MTSRPNVARGFTLIELTVVLAVLVTLALVLTPSITNFINDSRIARTRTDTQTLATAVVQFYKDNGFFPQWSTSNAGGPGTAANRVDLMVSPGNVPSVTSANTWTTGARQRSLCSSLPTRPTTHSRHRRRHLDGTVRISRPPWAPMRGITAT